MANVGKGPAGYPLTGRGAASPSGATFLPIGSESGLTAHGVVLAQGNGAFVATAVGTAGQVLTSNGAAVDPSFQDVSAPFSPNSKVQLIDDFIGAITAGAGQLISNFFWSTSTTAAFAVASTPVNTHPGILTSFPLATGAAFISARNNTAGTLTDTMVLGAGAIALNWVFRLATLSNGTNRYTIMFGMGDTVTGTDQANGCYIRYSDNVNSGNWQFVTASATTRTTSNSSIAADTNWHNFSMVINANATSVEYFIDGVSLGTAITTNIPTAAPISPMMEFSQSAGTVAIGSILVDLFYMQQDLTTPR